MMAARAEVQQTLKIVPTVVEETLAHEEQEADGPLIGLRDLSAEAWANAHQEGKVPVSRPSPKAK
jgi:hypothetical protein